MSVARPIAAWQLDVAHDAREGLSARPKRLPPRLFYDEAGSALFEEITRLPEYYLTRTELGIFERCAGEIIDQAGSNLILVELGVGSGRKTAVLIEALLQRQRGATFFPVDVSHAALDVASRTLSARFPDLEIHPLEGNYRSSLAAIRGRPGRKLVLFIGSSIGNFDPDEAVALLSEIRAGMGPGDALLLGTDLRKDPHIVLPAYDDAAGVTARFNKNVLARLNRELGADFALDRYRHVALWNDEASRIEMHLEADGDQHVRIPALEMDVRLDAGERIHTENSYKFTGAMVERILRASRFVVEARWTDARGWFAEHLARAR